MRSQNRSVLVITLLLVLVACTRPLATPNTGLPLAPPDTLSAPTTTRPAPTTTLDVEHTSISRVDPITLEPLAEYGPLPMGDWADWYWSDISDDGRWLAITVGNERRGSSELRLVDLENWVVAMSWPVSMGGPLHVDDLGTVHSFGGSAELLSYSTAAGGIIESTGMPVGFSTWFPIDSRRDTLRMFGSTTTGMASQASIVVVDLPSGELRQLPLPEVPFGAVDQLEISPTETAVVDATPAVVWKPESAIVVHAGEDVVTEVDLTTGASTVHRFGPAELEISEELDGSLDNQVAYLSNPRTAALAPDGRTLFVATQVSELISSEGSWQTSSTPMGVIAIDTVDWEVIDSLDAPISSISISPDGDRLLGTGYRDTQAVNSYTYESSSYYLIDPSNLGILSEFGLEDPTTDSFGPVSYGPDGLAYLTSWGGPMAEIQVVELANGNVVNTFTGPELWMLGPFGVLGQVDSGS
jgi:hypothetical protein